MDRETHASLANTQEFMALWNTAREEHFVTRLLPLLPHLISGSATLNPEEAEWTARNLVRALHIAAIPEGGVHAAIAYLDEVTAGRRGDIS